MAVMMVDEMVVLKVGERAEKMVEMMDDEMVD